MARRRRIMKRIVKSSAMHGLLSFIVSLTMRAVFLTARVHHHRSNTVTTYASGDTPAVFCFWHGRLIMQPFIKPKKRPLAVLISHHNDGALITATLRWFGISAVRGSSKRGSAAALRRMLDLKEAGSNIGITPDGPRGPNHVAALGAAYVAAKTGYPMVPVAYSSSRNSRLRSWDRFMIPKLFSQLHFVVGEPIFVTDDTSEAIEKATALLQEELNRVTAEADRYCEVTA